MPILDDTKLSLRLTGSDFDIEVQDLIEAAKLDLKLSGVLEAKIIDTDPLIKRAIILYCKAHFGYDNPDADRFMESYNMLKTHLTLSSDYTEGSIYEI